MFLSLVIINLSIALCALVVDRLWGYPKQLFRMIKHPVVWIGAVLSPIDHCLNRSCFSSRRRRVHGCLTLCLILAITLVAVLPLTLFLRSTYGGIVIEAFLASTFLAQKSLKDHVQYVHQSVLESVERGRQAVSLIVGRDPAFLDESGVCQAAVESLAENTSDGVIAPLFWLVLLGLPGAALYKAINTADSMIGYKNESYAAFGWAAAKCDDLVNLPASRLCAFLFVFTAILKPGANGTEALLAVRRDANAHLSPNAGWPEAAMAGALGIKLGGWRTYGNKRIKLAAMGRGRTNLTGCDIALALSLYRWTLTLATICTGLLLLLAHQLSQYT